MGSITVDEAIKAHNNSTYDGFTRWIDCPDCNGTGEEPELADMVEDGFGSAVCAWCPKCGQKTMEVVRPGKFQCTNCG